jgi:hypothetical protein
LKGRQGDAPTPSFPSAKIPRSTFSFIHYAGSAESAVNPLLCAWPVSIDFSFSPRRNARVSKSENGVSETEKWHSPIISICAPPQQDAPSSVPFPAGNIVPEKLIGEESGFRGCPHAVTCAAVYNTVGWRYSRQFQGTLAAA